MEMISDANECFGVVHNQFGWHLVLTTERDGVSDDDLELDGKDDL